jgi:hypothetical protein
MIAVRRGGGQGYSYISEKKKAREARAVTLLIHVKVALEDTFLHGIGDSRLLGHLAGGRRLHDGDALGALVLKARVQRVCSRHGGALSTQALVLGKVVALACLRQNRRQLVLCYMFDYARVPLELVGEKKRQDSRSRSRRRRGRRRHS